jgi:hypothetical protein
MACIGGVIEEFESLGHFVVIQCLSNSDPILEDIYHEICSKKISNLFVEDHKMAE